jgi:predicted exporter
VLGICALSGWLITNPSNGSLVNANLMALLPKAERDPVVYKAVGNVEKRFERYIAVLVGTDQFETTKAAARHVYERLTVAEPALELRLDDYQDLVQQAVSFYFPLRFQLLGNVAREQLKGGETKAFTRLVLSRYYNPKSTINSQLIGKDPLLLLPSFLEERAEAAADGPEIRDGFLTVKSNDKIYIAIIGNLPTTPFSVSLQQILMPILNDIRQELPERFNGVDFLMAGVLPHAAAGTKSALDETSTVGLGSLLAIVVLMIVTFRSSRPLLLTLISIALGCLGGFAACIAVFGEIHLLTLVFGASLVGISVDYSLHYFCERFRFTDDWSGRAALRHVFPGITLGLITSVIGFVGLFFAPFPGMQGMALFSSVGLCVAYGCVVICYPHFSRTIARPKFEWPLDWARAYAAFWHRERDWRIWITALIFSGLAALGCWQLVAVDDVRLLQTPNPIVMAEEMRTRTLIGRNLASQFFLVEGRDTEDFLAREERLTAKLRALQKSDQLAGYLAISDFIASPERQMENRELIGSLIEGKTNTLRHIGDQIGLPDATRQAYVAMFVEASRKPPVTLEAWLAHPVSKPHRRLWLGRSERGVIGVTGLRGVYDLEILRSIAEDDPKLHFIDPAGDISDLFGQYRRQTVWLTLISYAIVTLLLVVRYGVGGGMMVMATPAIAAIAALSVLGFLGEPISLFNIMALLLVLGIGVDYALFFRETGADNPATMLAIAMSSLTTLLAFGLLALSATNAIHAFGLTIMVGIIVAFLLSPIAGWYVGKPAK